MLFSSSHVWIRSNASNNSLIPIHAASPGGPFPNSSCHESLLEAGKPFCISISPHPPTAPQIHTAHLEQISYYPGLKERSLSPSRGRRAVPSFWAPARSRGGEGGGLGGAVLQWRAFLSFRSSPEVLGGCPVVCTSETRSCVLLKRS